MSPADIPRQSDLKDLSCKTPRETPIDPHRVFRGLQNRDDPPERQTAAGASRGGKKARQQKEKFEALFNPPACPTQWPWHASTPHPFRRPKTDSETRDGLEFWELLDRRFPGRFAARGAL